MPDSPELAPRFRHLARSAATAILDGFDAYFHAFREISARARDRFEQRDWRGWQLDSSERLVLREQIIQQVALGLREMLGVEVYNADLWREVKHSFARLISRVPNQELAETYYNSVTRRLMGTVGVNRNLEFVWFGATMLPGRDVQRSLQRYVRLTDMVSIFRTILGDYHFATPWAALEEDCALVAAALERELTSVWETPDFESIEMLRSVFYRNKGAYLIGRIRRRNQVLPLVLPILNTDAGLQVDAALFSEEEASRVFSFTRAYFHVDADNPVEIVGFLKSIMPLKPIAELYTAIGWNKHGKTMLFRSLYRHLGNSSDRFQIAGGARGMVMVVFTLPSYDVVFKVIRDRFAEAKTITRRDVLDRYHFVFRHDRVGRMVDAQEFENLIFARERFTEELLAELAETARNTIEITDSQVIVRHLYTERRLYPLDLYIKEMTLEHARVAIDDYGHAIADLAAANIFPGDLFIKNFGVTRHDRVVFYDYDEVTLLTECNFRRMPVNTSYDDEIAATPWFSVAPNDIFPEEFRTFLWLPAPLREEFDRNHGHLFSVEWWQDMQARIRSGEIVDIFPYGYDKRLRP